MEQWRRYRHPHVYRGPTAPQRRSRRQLRLSRGSLAVLAGLVAVAAAGWLLFGSGYFTIRTVQASGEVTPKLQAGLDDLKGTSILFFKERNLMSRLQAIDPAVSQVQVVRGFPDQIHVTITRRHPALVWQSGNTQWAIDDQGVAFPINDPSVTAGRPLIVDRRDQPVQAGQKLVAPEFVRFVTQAFAQAPAAIGGRVVRAEVDETTFYIYLITEWNWSIILDTTRPVEGQLANLTLLLKDHRADIHQYVDLRIAGRAYVQ